MREQGSRKLDGRKRPVLPIFLPTSLEALGAGFIAFTSSLQTTPRQRREREGRRRANREAARDSHDSVAASGRTCARRARANGSETGSLLNAHWSSIPRCQTTETNP